ncbi:hypothetical protein ABT026_07420 [Streptomyces sp. NPDC002734]|uniref:SCO4225 family membrane protein n=1 Tax=Streptomyces sp. NPDC002734 TaxID=3154426 RepID=UPI003333FC3D
MNARTLIRLTFANPASAAYLGLFGASVAFEVAAALFSDPGIVGIWPVLIAAPTSLLAAGLDAAIGGADSQVWFLVGGVCVSALIQSFVLGAFLEFLRGRRRGPARPSRG